MGIAISGKLFAAIFVNFPNVINALPDRSPNLEIKVSINTVDLCLSFFLKVLKKFFKVFYGKYIFLEVFKI